MILGLLQIQRVKFTRSTRYFRARLESFMRMTRTNDTHHLQEKILIEFEIVRTTSSSF